MTNAAMPEMERLRQTLAGLPDDFGKRIAERAADIAEGAKLALDTMQTAECQKKNPS